MSAVCRRFKALRHPGPSSLPVPSGGSSFGSFRGFGCGTPRPSSRRRSSESVLQAQDPAVLDHAEVLVGERVAAEAADLPVAVAVHGGERVPGYGRRSRRPRSPRGRPCAGLRRTARHTDRRSLRNPRSFRWNTQSLVRDIWMRFGDLSSLPSWDSGPLLTQAVTSRQAETAIQGIFMRGDSSCVLQLGPAARAPVPAAPQ